HLGLAEGIETALSVTQLYGIPCWATGDAGRMERFKLPAGVEQVTIFADVDHSHTGEAAAESLARRLILQHKIPVEVRRDCPRGQDYNDLLMQRIREAS
ncbi:toprim domain-containing protein, partial [Pseudomonas aeruginosa]|nr:toprim domain-containing protein [Pseudomonas aeruginosa]